MLDLDSSWICEKNVFFGREGHYFDQLAEIDEDRDKDGRIDNERDNDRNKDRKRPGPCGEKR